MRGRSALVALGGLVVLGLAGCGSSAKTNTGANSASTTAATASECTPGPNLTKTVLTARYKMVLDVNPTETMYTQAQVAAQHPTTGEVMLRGQMNGMSGTGNSSSTTMMGTATTMGHAPMSTTSTSPMGHSSMTTSTTVMGNTSTTGMGGTGGANERHLEVHVCSRSTGKVVQNAQPTITVVDHAGTGMTDHVSVAEMEGIGATVADLHYGNNVTMPAMHRYTVTVVLNGEKAAFDITRAS
jgi:hypothetical protein